MNTEQRSQRNGTLVLRLGLGVIFVAHALVKLLVFGLPGTAAFFESVGFPGFMAYVVFGIELAAGALLILGWQTRWAALATVPVMLGAISVHWGNGWNFSNANGGWEFPAFLAAAALALFLHGDDGSLSLSRALAPSRRREDRSVTRQSRAQAA